MLAVEGVSGGVRQHQQRQVSEGGVVVRGRDLTSVMQEGEGGRTMEGWKGISNNPHMEQRMKVDGSLRGCGVCGCRHATVFVHTHVVCCWMHTCMYTCVHGT